MMLRPSASLRRARRAARAGFTLLEILVALAILGLLVGLAVGNFGKIFDDSRKDTVSIFVNQSTKVPLQSYRMHLGDFPSTSEGLQALITAPGGKSDRWRGPYMDVKGDQVPKDPWGNTYQYRYPGTKNKNGPDIWSFGPDGQDGTADDIGNW